jgi:hypothetical protein
MYKKPLDE